MGVEAMVESVDLVRDGEAPKIVQDEALATYESWCRKDDVEIDWAQPVRDGPQPDPRRAPAARARGRRSAARRSTSSTASQPTTGDGPPGRGPDVGGDGFVVATADGAVTVTGVRADGDKLAGSEYAERAGLQPGAVLGER